ncbi:hyalin-like [Amphiura filiformis]|uniref:hyalin-like n=1 Tax=Amphiura filiformis TaxID=82378 RepID=UPI003B2278E7
MKLLLLLSMLGLAWAISVNKLRRTEDEEGETKEVDNEPPFINGCPDDITRTASIGLPSTRVTWRKPTATDNSGTVSLISRSIPPGSFFRVGTTTVTYIFADESGNSATCIFDVNVIGPAEDERIEYLWSLGKTKKAEDNQAPFIDCPDGITRIVDAGVTSTAVTWFEPTATDNSGTVYLEEQTHSPGSFFAPGYTFVTYTFVDRSGNTAFCTFYVHVIQNEEYYY